MDVQQIDTAQSFVTIDAAAFDTEKITATLNRMLAESARFEPQATLVAFQVLGYQALHPSTLRVCATVRYRANNCLVEVPYDVDAGALRGLEVGLGAD